MVGPRHTGESFRARVPDGGTVGQEHHVEPGPLGRARYLRVVAEVDAAVGLRPGMAPGGHVVAGRHQERAKPELRVASCHNCPPAPHDGASRRVVAYPY